MSLPYSQKPIDELMDELEALGGSSQVRMNSFVLLAITGDCQQVASYNIDDEQQQSSSFLTLKGYRKKYHYHQLHSCLSAAVLSEPLVQFYSGFNVNVLLMGLTADELLRLLPKSDDVALSHVGYSISNDRVVDLISGAILQPRFEQDFYRCNGHNIRLASHPEQITVTRILYPSKTNSQLRLVTLPDQLVAPTNNQTRSQLSQIVEYIRKNRDKFSKENLSKLFIKKSRAVSMLIDTVFDNSLNWLVNGLSDSQQQLENVMEYANRLKGIPNFARRANRKDYRIRQYQPSSEAPSKPKHPTVRGASRSGSHEQSNTIVIEEQMTHQTELDVDREDFNYCRSLERKTHKYSTSPKPSAPAEQFQHSSIDPRIQALPPNEKLSILQAEHMIEISKYHQTIQSLNTKLLTFSKQNGLEELCGEYEREIMQLELRLDDMRQQLNLMAQGDQVSLKKVVRKLTEQLSEKFRQKSSVPKELSKVYTSSVQNLKRQLEASEKSKQLLSEQLSLLTKRLESRQNEIADLNKKFQQYERPSQQSIDRPTLNVKTEKQYMELVTLLQQLNEGNGLTYVFIRKKLSALFETLSMSKKALVECHSFLLELQTLLETKLSTSNPTIVLDCNRFIRSFMMKTLEIQE